MGIRFRCHQCEHELNLKNFQAGRRARCPVCSGRFRVPTESAPYSLPLELNELEISPTDLAARPDLELDSSSNSDSSVVTEAPSSSAPTKTGADVATKSVATKVGSDSASTSTKASARSESNRSGTGSLRRSVEISPLALRAAPATGATTAKATSRVAASEAASAPASASAATAPASTQATSSSTRTAAWPSAVAEAPTAIWYVRPAGGGQFGPAEAATFADWLAEGRIAPDSLVWRDGWPEWLVASAALHDFFAPASSGEITSIPASLAVSVAPANNAMESVRPVSAAAVATATPGDVGQPIKASSRTSSSGPTTLVARRKRKRSRYALGIGLLALVAVVLLAVLVVVVMRR